MSTNNAADYSPTQYNVQVGGVNGTLVNVVPSATAGVPLVSGGSSANPSFTTAVVTGGGTGAVTLTGVLIGNGTSPVTGNAITQYDVLVGGASNAITSIANGTTGQVFTATTGSDPSWASPATSSITIVGDSGGGLTGSSFTFTGGTTGLLFSGSGTTETLTISNLNLSNTNSAGTSGEITFGGTRFISNFGTANTFAGTNSGNTTVTSTDNVGIGTNSLSQVSDSGSNTCLGSYAGRAIASGSSGNTCIGYVSGFTLSSGSSQNVGLGTATNYSLTTGSQNTALGSVALNYNSTGTGNCGVGYNALITLGYPGNTGGDYNTAVGWTSLGSLLTGSYNSALGYEAGVAYSGSESNNITIGANVPGLTGESNVTRIGNTSTDNVFITGINGVTVTGSAVLCSTSGELGTVVSSERYKENINDMGSASNDLMKLRPVTFNYKNHDGRQAYGLIAEEVAEIYPDLVVYDKSGECQSVMYHEMPALLLNEIQKLRRELNELKALCGI